MEPRSVGEILDYLQRLRQGGCTKAAQPVTCPMTIGLLDSQAPTPAVALYKLDYSGSGF